VVACPYGSCVDREATLQASERPHKHPQGAAEDNWVCWEQTSVSNCESRPMPQTIAKKAKNNHSNFTSMNHALRRWGERQYDYHNDLELKFSICLKFWCICVWAFARVPLGKLEHMTCCVFFLD
jgi:hypothetical protein